MGEVKKKNVLKNLISEGDRIEQREPKIEKPRDIEPESSEVEISHVSSGDDDILDGLDLNRRMITILKPAEKSKTKKGKSLPRTQTAILTSHSDKLNQIAVAVGINKIDIIDNLLSDFLEKESGNIKKIMLKSLDM